MYSLRYETKLEAKRITVLGGTGTLGKALIPEINHRWPKAEITVVSRDEHKQAAMIRELPYCKYAIGDIRDERSMRRHLADREIVFHVAALKHVDILEGSPLESIKTNVLATDTLADQAIQLGVSHFIFSSTDKAVDPINAYGYSKALSEKILYDANTRQSRTKFSVYRWGNVLGSQGSVIPTFARTLSTEGKAYITNREMTRFWLPIEWAIKYMMRSFTSAHPDRAMVPPNMKAARVEDVIAAVAQILGVKGYQLIEMGMRPGEKIHEAMYSQHSPEFLTSEMAEKYTMDELISMLTPIVGMPGKLAA